MRLIQRVGRIDRIGSEYSEVWAFNFLPDDGLDKELSLKSVVRRRIQEIHETIGEDAKVLEETETLNTADLYSIYVKGEMPEDEDDDLFSVQEAIEILRRLRNDEPELFARVSSLADGVRASRAAPQQRKKTEAEAFSEEMEREGIGGIPPGNTQLALDSEFATRPAAAQLVLAAEKAAVSPGTPGAYVLCSAGGVKQAYFATADDVREVDIAHAVRAFRCPPEEPAREQPDWLNVAVERARSAFALSIDQLKSVGSPTRPAAQKWVLKQLGDLARSTEDTGERQRYGTLHRAFDRPITQTLVHLLRGLQRRSVPREELVEELDEIASAYDLYVGASSAEKSAVTSADVRVVCSQVHVR